MSSSLRPTASAKAGPAGDLERGAVEADDAALGVGEDDAEVEGVEGLPPLLGRLPELGLEAALPFLRLHPLGDVADGADPHGAAPVGGRGRAPRPGRPSRPDAGPGAGRAPRIRS